MTPYILLVRKKLPSNGSPSPEHVYDAHRQLWVDKKSGIPLVLSMRAHGQSEFGETTITETREGADQTEGVDLQASAFGETSITKTFEGADQSERTAFEPTEFGETTLTYTQEGADQTERSVAVQVDAPYSHF
jgi:hypothetical protein